MKVTGGWLWIRILLPHNKAIWMVITAYNHERVRWSCGQQLNIKFPFSNICDVFWCSLSGPKCWSFFIVSGQLFYSLSFNASQGEGGVYGGGGGRLYLASIILKPLSDYQYGHDGPLEPGYNVCTTYINNINMLSPWGEMLPGNGWIKLHQFQVELKTKVRALTHGK